MQGGFNWPTANRQSSILRKNIRAIYLLGQEGKCARSDWLIQTGRSHYADAESVANLQNSLRDCLRIASRILPRLQEAALSRHAVAVAGRIRNHQELGIDGRLIANLMRLTRTDMDALTRAQYKFGSADFDGQSASQHVEELVRLLMVVTNLRSARRHAFFDDAQCGRLDEVPSIAAITPRVMLGWFACRSFPSGKAKGPPEAGPLHDLLLPDQPHRQRLGARVAFAVGHGQIEEEAPGAPREVHPRSRRGPVIDGGLVAPDRPVEAQRVVARRAERAGRIQPQIPTVV